VFSSKFYLTVHTILQATIALFVGMGLLPQETVYASLVLQVVAILFFDLEKALHSIILAIPFYLVIPNPWFDSLSVWRIAFALIFLRWIWHDRIIDQKGLHFERIRFAPWDKYLLIFAAVILLSIIPAEFKGVGLKKLIFLFNIYLLYIVGLNAVKSREEIKRLLWIGLASFGSIILFGFVQLFISLRSNLFYFWQYWATYPARAFYGQEFADTSVYSNSWMVFTHNQALGLRMYSILPDSHSFALIAVFALPFALALAIFTTDKWKKRFAWLMVVLASWGIIFSGTRGVWLGALSVLFGILLLAYWKRGSFKHLRYMLIPIFLLAYFFMITPLTQQALNFVAGAKQEFNFLSRASSVTDLDEQSNYGRLDIWKHSVGEIAERPLLGTGFGNFVVALENFVLPESDDYEELSSSREEKFNLPARYITAHSLYLDFLVELGILGLIAFLTYLISLVKTFWLYFKERFQEWEMLTFFALNFGIYLLWLFSYSLFDGTLLNDRVLMYYLIGMFLSANIIKLQQNG
jgi:O-antigen ligase